MSVVVSLEDLGDEISQRGNDAYVITVGPEGPPKIHHTSVELSADGALTCTVGRGSANNVAARPQVTLLWPGTPAITEGRSLLVDGTAAVVATDPHQVLQITPTGAIQHRSA